MSLPLIVTGMHRSGTSLTASLIQAIGVDFGENLLPGDCFNAKGYFEDVDFLEFQRSRLQESCPPGDPGWPDWGWTESETLDRDRFNSHIHTAKAIVSQRDRASIWGWKDPRTSLMLDFWHQLLPEARYVFVYRLPWDVVDSIIRLNSTIFSQRPDYAIRSWAYYNRQILAFYRQYPKRCLLLNVNSVLQQPTRLVELLKIKLGLPLSENVNPARLQEIYDPHLFKQLEDNHPLVQFLQNPAFPYLSLLQQLDSIADIPSQFSASPQPNSAPPLELFPLMLHHRALQAHSQLESLSQLQQDKRALQAQNQQLTAEINNIKSSKLGKVQQTWVKIKGWLIRQGLSRLLGKTTDAPSEFVPPTGDGVNLR
jgi:hypothetical protein